jgi:hypothetical protein
MFAWLNSHQQPAVFFSQHKSATAISHQPNEQAVGELEVTFLPPFVNFCFFFGWGRKDTHASVDARHLSHLVILLLQAS